LTYFHNCAPQISMSVFVKKNKREYPELILHNYIPGNFQYPKTHQLVEENGGGNAMQLDYHHSGNL
jgi:hypothetical protein